MILVERCNECGHPLTFGPEDRGGSVTCSHCGGVTLLKPFGTPQKRITTRYRVRRAIKLSLAILISALIVFWALAIGWLVVLSWAAKNVQSAPRP